MKSVLICEARFPRTVHIYDPKSDTCKSEDIMKMNTKSSEEDKAKCQRIHLTYTKLLTV